MRYRPQLVALMAGLLCFSVAASSQEASPQTGSPSAGGGNSQTGSAAGASAQAQGGSHSLTGAFLYTLGSPFEGRSYIQPVFGVTEAAQANPSYGVNGRQSFAATTIPVAEISLVHRTRTNELEAAYIGGAYIYTGGAAPDASFHELTVTDMIMRQRWQIGLSDLFSYLPEASFGFGGVGAFGGMGIGLPSGLGLTGGLGIGGGSLINPMYTPNQSILTSQFGAYNNTAIAEASYRATARTSFSFGGAFGTLQSGKRGAGFINGNNTMAFGGIQRELTARDNLGVMYNYSTFHYVGLTESFKTQMFSLAYGRRVTGTLALQLYGGPEFTNYQLGPGATFSRTGFSGTAALTYTRARNTFGLFVSHYSTGGSGVFAGADTTEVTGSWERQLTRRWDGRAYGGYARNSEITQAGIPTSGRYGSWFANADASRNIGHYVRFYVGYEYQRQTTNSASCRAGFCAGSITSQMLGAGFMFSPRPIGL